MTKEWLVREKKKLEAEIQKYDALEEAGLIDKVSFINNENIFLEPDVDFIETRRAFRDFFHTSEELNSYYMSLGRLAVNYSYGAWHVIFPFSNVEEMLEKLSGGTCYVEERKDARTEKVVVCNRS